MSAWSVGLSHICVKVHPHWLTCPAAADYLAWDEISVSAGVDSSGLVARAGLAADRGIATQPGEYRPAHANLHGATLLDNPRRGGFQRFYGWPLSCRLAPMAA